MVTQRMNAMTCTGKFHRQDGSFSRFVEKYRIIPDRERENVRNTLME